MKKSVLNGMMTILLVTSLGLAGLSTKQKNRSKVKFNERSGEKESQSANKRKRQKENKD